MKILYNDIMDAFECLNIIRSGHFKLSSGRHSDTYIQKDLIHLYPRLYNNINYTFYNIIKHSLKDFNLITGPPLAGAFFAKTLAYDCNKPFIYPEKVNGEIVLKRGFDKIIKGKNVLIAEDIITTGGSVEKLIRIIEDNGGTVFKVLCIWNRNNWDKYDCEGIIRLTLNDYEPENCPLCKEGIRLIDPKE